MVSTKKILSSINCFNIDNNDSRVIAVIAA